MADANSPVEIYSSATTQADNSSDSPPPMVVAAATDLSSPPLLTPFNQLDAWAVRQDSIAMLMRRVAEYQLQAYGELPGPGWTTGTFFSSFIAAYRATGERWYLKKMQAWAGHLDWAINNPVHADELCPAQSYLDLHFIKKDRAALAELDQRLSQAYFDRREIKPGELHDWDQNTYPFDGAHLWSWADALYMAPPVLARMGKATGDARYYQTLHKLYWPAVAKLYDADAQLLFRDQLPKSAQLRSPSGQKIFWGRGMGWVMAGLARTIDYLDDKDPEKKRYLALFQQLSFSLLHYQQNDGLWRSALTEPGWYTTKETSASAFFTYALAKGVNEGWLPRQYFLPSLLKAWSGLAASIEPSGKLGYSQIVAGSPHEVRARDSVDYAAGALILAGAQMLKLNAHKSLLDLSSAPFQPRFVAANAQWPASSSQPVIKQQAVFFALHNTLKKHEPAQHEPESELPQTQAAISAFTGGQWPNVSAYARKQKILNQAAAMDSAALLSTEDQQLLALYNVSSGSGASGQLLQRKIKLPTWSPMVLQAEQVSARESRRWLQLHSLKTHAGEPLTLQFFIDEQASLRSSQSTDAGASWSKGAALIHTGASSAENVQLNSVSQGDILHLLLSVYDGPNTGIYYLRLADAQFASADGTPLANLKLPAVINELAPAAVPYLGQNSVSSFKLEDMELYNGRPLIALALSSASSHQWQLLSLNETGAWQTEKLLEFDAKRLAEKINAKNLDVKALDQNSSDGKKAAAEQTAMLINGLSLVPDSNSTLLVSSRVQLDSRSPTYGQALAQDLYQLFKGQFKQGRWHWQQLSFDPLAHQVKPHIVRGDQHALFWQCNRVHNKKIIPSLRMSDQF
ncbi:glycoside hydrolase family 88/105 protein [Agaribacterium haliotis]|uniref:glycoside hydrolase family 88/105 protein n=1 Tax=Agaribacterium haliotis TaxID=2013869 RepID=UPI001304667E|nr:glycoside hydrolase family 88 protein [Agaribacterium haliotis]